MLPNVRTGASGVPATVVCVSCRPRQWRTRRPSPRGTRDLQRLDRCRPWAMVRTGATVRCRIRPPTGTERELAEVGVEAVASHGSTRASQVLDLDHGPTRALRGAVGGSRGARVASMRSLAYRLERGQPGLERTRVRRTGHESGDGTQPGHRCHRGGEHDGRGPWCHAHVFGRCLGAAGDEHGSRLQVGCGGRDAALSFAVVATAPTRAGLRAPLPCGSQVRARRVCRARALP